MVCEAYCTHLDVLEVDLSLLTEVDNGAQEVEETYIDGVREYPDMWRYSSQGADLRNS